jgi:protein tyrosine phosphatase
MNKTKILMVCLGNICRSPLAEGVMRSKLPADRFEVDSAGTANYHVGDAPDPRSIASGKKHGVDISALKGRQFATTDFNVFDYIFVMDRSNYQNLIKLAPTSRELRKISFLADALGTMTKHEIPDPYYGEAADFEKVYQMIDTACNKVAEKLIPNS